jgi:hypothetical protein
VQNRLEAETALPQAGPNDHAHMARIHASSRLSVAMTGLGITRPGSSEAISSSTKSECERSEWLK